MQADASRGASTWRGSPSRSEPVGIPLSRPSITAAERDAVASCLSSEWVSGTGPWVRRFEAALAHRLARTFVIATSSGTSALEVVLRALGIGPGDEVIVPALTFVSPAAAVKSCGATPVLCDIDDATWTIDVAAAAELRTPRTRAIICVDLLGHPCDYEVLGSLGVPLIEDAAQAHGSLASGRPAGSFGLASVLSFHANKAVTTGEGGCIATDDGDLAERCRLIANHGMRGAKPYHHDVVGTNARMTSLAAALGVAQLARWDELIDGRRAIARRYEHHLTTRQLDVRRRDAPWADPSCWLFTYETDRRAVVLAALRAEGVDARAVWPPLSTLPLYRDNAPKRCEVAESVAEHLVWLPTWHGLDEHKITAVAETINDVCTRPLPLRRS